ncbi:HD-GYP domain-containing protein [Cohnella panacarvi]|uniref:HD-GYP domain-containing protein n=1 Tax=Cohnella panacarvi TaxID=400776 RepID=UPI000478C5B1|nr:HD domain-containing protein [Cohnella panacarvi]
MLILPVEKVVNGDLLGRGIYSPDGRLMLKEGVALNEKLIEGIKRLGQKYIFVELTAHRASENSDLNKISHLMNLTEEILQQIFQAVRQLNNIPVRPLLEWADHVTEVFANDSDLTMSTKDLSTDPAELISHSLNVCFLSLITAKTLGYNKKQLEEVAIGSLLHDIGLVLPHDGSLMMHHPIIGYDMLKKVKGIPDGALRIVLQHHEQIDGHGFPFGISYSNCNEAAQICGVASDFDYFMNDKTASRLPAEGIDMVMSKIDTSCSYAVARAFIKTFQPYPVGTMVALTGGLTGRVTAINKANPSRPVIVLDRCNTKVDLMAHTTFQIEKVLMYDSIGG